MRRRIKVLKILIIIIAVSIATYLFLGNLTCQRLACVSVKDGNQYKIKKIYEDNKYTFRALYEKNNVLLRMEAKNNFSAQEAQQVIQSQIVRMQGVFEDAAAPYPGELSDIITCGKEFQPIYSAKKQNGIQMAYFTGFVNERLVFGSCASDQAAYRDTLTMFYCPQQKKFYQLEIITPNKNSATGTNQHQEILDSIACRE